MGTAREDDGPLRLCVKLHPDHNTVLTFRAGASSKACHVPDDRPSLGVVKMGEELAMNVIQRPGVTDLTITYN